MENLQQCVLGKQPSVPAPPEFLTAKKQKLIDKLNKRVSFDVCVHRHDVDSMLHHCPVVTVGIHNIKDGQGSNFGFDFIDIIDECPRTN